MGFGAKIESLKSQKIGDSLKHILPQDLLKFGLIPEFIGRLPVISTLHSLDKEALIRILVEPKNALVKQYQKLFEIDDVILEVEKETLEVIAEKALSRDTGARGLRAILEEIMLDVMFDIPTEANVEKCTLKKDTDTDRIEPVLNYNENKKAIKRVANKKPRVKRESVS